MCMYSRWLWKYTTSNLYCSKLQQYLWYIVHKTWLSCWCTGIVVSEADITYCSIHIHTSSTCLPPSHAHSLHIHIYMYVHAHFLHIHTSSTSSPLPILTTSTSSRPPHSHLLHIPILTTSTSSPPPHSHHGVINRWAPLIYSYWLHSTCTCNPLQ